MLTPEEIIELSEPVCDVYRKCVDELLVNIAAHLKGGQTGSLEWEVQKLGEMGQLRRESVEIIKRNTGTVPQLLDGSLGSAITKTLSRIDPELAKAAAKNLLFGISSEPTAAQQIENVLANYSRQARDQLNLVNTVMLDHSLAQFSRVVTNTFTYRRQLDAAQGVLDVRTGSVALGISSRQTALRKAVAEINRAGLSGFKDAAGHNWSVEAYVNMDVRTTVHNVSTQTVFTRNEQYGNSLVSTSAHAGARPLCYPYQGQVFSTDGSAGTVEDLNGNTVSYTPLSDTSYGLPAGLLGINCGHMIYPFVAGLSVVHDRVTQDQEQNDKQYAESQKQRQLERNVREAKREAAMLNAAGDKEGFEKAAAKIQNKQDKLRAFTERTGRTLRVDRTQVFGYDKSVSGKVAALNRAKRNERFDAAAARLFETKTEADKYYRPWLDKSWDKLRGKEKYSIWEYTHNSNPINKPLSGYQGKWTRDHFVGVDKARWNYESRWRTVPDEFAQYGVVYQDGKAHVSQKNVIHDLTRAIDKYEIPRDVIVRRGSDFNGLAGILEGSQYSYEKALAILNTGDVKLMNEAFAGGTYINHAFTSTGVAADAGFSGNVRYSILLPKGTHAIYAEPQSAWGNTVGDDGAVDPKLGGNPDLVPPKLYVPGMTPNRPEIGWECEIIVQRGTAYRVNSITKSGEKTDDGKDIFDIMFEVVDQPKFKTGWERTC